jgi:hypothetical protein
LDFPRLDPQQDDTFVTTGEPVRMKSFLEVCVYKVKLPFLSMIFCLALAACSPLALQQVNPTPVDPTSVNLTPVFPTQGSPTQIFPIPSVPPDGSKGLETRPPFLDDLAKSLAKDLSAPAEQVILKEYRAVEWPNACLGLAQADVVCAQTITPGYLVVFSTPKGDIELHTNAAGTVYRQSASVSQVDERPAVITWQRSGGFAGICNRLIVYADGSYLLQNCIQSTAINQGQLPSEVLTRVKEWVGKYSSFRWNSVRPAGSADMFTDELSFNGQGSEKVTDSQKQDIFSYLAGWVAQLKK